MELANCFVALAGDNGHIVQKFGVTPSEVAVLQLIHGDDAVSEIEIFGSDTRRSRDERDRLCQVYGVNNEGQITARAVDMLFPGAAARLFETFEELSLPESAYKEIVTRVSPEDKAPKRTRKKSAGADPVPVQDTAPVTTAADPDDDFEDMPGVMG